nr:cysteine desulfurase-like protein [Actibacterium sp. 188UL27-1]
MNTDFLKQSFPALSGSQVYFDNAGGSQVARHVGDRLVEYLYTANVQLGASYPASAQAGQMVDAGRAALAMLMNAARPEEVVMGATSTQLLGQLAQALSQDWQPGDEVVVTNFDHEANIGPWVKLADKGIVIREWKMPHSAHEPDLADLRSLLSDRTKLVAVTHASNIYGTINPIPKIAQAVRKAGALICVDGVAYAPHRAVDVQALGVDFYVFSAYKVYGPHFAALYGRYEALLAAGNINHRFFTRAKVPQKMEPGNANYELAYACTGIIDYLVAFAQEHGINMQGRAAIEGAFDVITAHEERLSDRLLDYLRKRTDATIIGAPEADHMQRVPTISFTLADRNSRDVVEAVDPTGLGIRYGDFYSRSLVEGLNLPNADGVIRVSAVHYNSVQDIDRLISALEAA